MNADIANADFDLAALDDQYAATAAPEKKAGPPDGRYQVKVEAVDLEKSKTKGTPTLVLELLIISGEHAGRKLWKRSAITAGSLPYLKQDLLTLGWTKTLRDLQDPMQRRSLLDVAIQVTKKTKQNGQYDDVNIYIDKRITVTAEQVQAASAARTTGDEPPF